MDVVSVEGEYITKEYAEEPGWHTVGKGKQANVESGVPGNEDQGKRLLSEVLARNKCTKGQKIRQVILASKMPNLPKEYYKIIMRPRGGFKVNNYGLDRLGCCVRNAAGIPRGESEGDIVCVNYKQNILVVSTPSDDRAAKYRHITSLKIGNQEFDTSAYEAAPENASKGIIRGISLEESPKDIWENLKKRRRQRAVSIMPKKQRGHIRTAKDHTEENSQNTTRGTRAKILEDETDPDPSLDSTEEKRAAQRHVTDPTVTKKKHTPAMAPVDPYR
ncbi:hypothetical protein HPB49_005769 [Dermacentor silvarum]|uniref:Uncharacterized protein n=1 Tax=Dermacentor silvarum TaxID=543639 RepID=A0ACB8DNA2_DERSI|nr:hypothetical protein HPB49_005769 [Dermacentor silvarum]